MSKLGPNQMNARKVDSLKDGVHSDGGNLWITIKGKSRVWSVRFQSPITGKRREMGIGPARDVSLAEARELAGAARKLLRQGIDPLQQRMVERADRLRSEALIFETVAARYIEDRKSGWRDARSETVWTSSLMRLAYPSMGRKPIDTLTTDDVLAVLRVVSPEVV